ncbi:MAG: hypothetical protein IJ555_04340 [Ruminococcus sp.]|nr:hypothetical protein [Ruminococcus sp.]
MKTNRLITALAALTLLTSCSGSADSSSQPAEETTTTTTAQTTTTTTTTTTTSTTTTTAEITTTSQPEESLPPQEDDPLSKERFEGALNNVSVEINGDKITETGSVNGTEYSLTIDLSKWAQFTTPEDMVQLSRLFWQSYPRMYQRFGDITGAPCDVILVIENEGYEIAEAGGDLVHLHDRWLHDNPQDYDCIAHELGHIAQNGWLWDENFLEYSQYIELFADLCRMEYPLDDGYYNDFVWTLQPVYGQDSRETSVRFLVWLDYMYSTEDIDVIRRFCDICYNDLYPAALWEDAWKDILKGTDADGKTIGELWDIYADSDFSYLLSYADKGEKSELLQSYDIRGRVRKLRG